MVGKRVEPGGRRPAHMRVEPSSPWQTRSAGNPIRMCTGNTWPSCPHCHTGCTETRPALGPQRIPNRLSMPAGVREQPLYPIRTDLTHELRQRQGVRRNANQWLGQIVNDILMDAIPEDFPKPSRIKEQFQR